MSGIREDLQRRSEEEEEEDGRRRRSLKATRGVNRQRRCSMALTPSDDVHRRCSEWRDWASRIGALWRRRSTVLALMLAFSAWMSLLDGASASSEAAVAKVAKERNDNAPSGNSDQEMPSSIRGGGTVCV